MSKQQVKQNKDPEIFDKVKCLQNELNSVIESKKQKYCRLSNKLIDQHKILLVDFEDVFEQ